MSTVGAVQYRGGTQITKDLFPTVLNTPTVLKISPHTVLNTAPRYWTHIIQSEYEKIDLSLLPLHPHFQKMLR